MKSKYNINFKIHEGFCDNYFPTKRDPINEFRLDIFYEYNDQIITLVMELMINDIEPEESKILNYITYIQVQNHHEIVNSNLEQIIKLVKFDKIFLESFIRNVQQNLRKDISDFEYRDLKSDISYYNHLNNHYDTENRIELPLNINSNSSIIEFWI